MYDVTFALTAQYAVCPMSQICDMWKIPKESVEVATFRLNFSAISRPIVPPLATGISDVFVTWETPGVAGWNF
jgi:hypothetical protein